MKNMVNALSIDVEDWYQVSDFNCIIKISDWDKYEDRLTKNTARILELLERYHTKATFFVLAWNAEREPQLVKDIHAAGHEISSHGYSHQLIYQQTVDEFAEDFKKSIHLIEDIKGYRKAFSKYRVSKLSDYL